MCNGVTRKGVRPGTMIDAEQLEEVTEYKYLERFVRSGNKISKENRKRITIGGRRFGEN